MNKKNVVIVGTIYSFFISLLLLKKDKTFYIFCNKMNKNIFDNLKAKKYYSKVYFEKRNLLGIILYYYNYLKIQVILFKLKKCNFYINDYLIETCFIKNSFLLEDGTSNYLEEQPLKKTLIRLLKLDFRKKIFGYSNRIKKIFLTGMAPIPEKIKDKVILINLKELWNKKTYFEQQEILEIFNINVKKLNEYSEKEIFLFTQPLSEDKVISENEKIEIYKKILKKYDTKKIIIKPHPREITNYNKYFPNILILDSVIPFEILKILGINPKKGVTLFSSAVFCLNSDIDFYGTEVHPKLLEYFGNCDYLMKRNSFI